MAVTLSNQQLFLDSQKFKESVHNFFQEKGKEYSWWKKYEHDDGVASIFVVVRYHLEEMFKSQRSSVEIPLVSTTWVHPKNSKILLTPNEVAKPVNENIYWLDRAIAPNVLFKLVVPALSNFLVEKGVFLTVSETKFDLKIGNE